MLVTFTKLENGCTVEDRVRYDSDCTGRVEGGNLLVLSPGGSLVELYRKGAWVRYSTSIRDKFVSK